jgi:sec-independent protein translocase protein TatA
MPVGPLELGLVALILLLLFGARRIPETGRALGTGMREFKESLLGGDESEDERPELEA